MNSVCIAGCGYVGRRLAEHYLARGTGVTAIVKTPGSREALVSAGIDARVVDLDHPDAVRRLTTDATLCYYLAPPPPEGGRDTRIRNFLDRMCDHAMPARIVYISTSGVYGDCRGAWIDETQPLKPETPRAKRRADAESVLHAWSEQTGKPVVILRVPGIYGPGRLPLERIRKKLPVLQETDSPYTNRIHVDDLVAACLAAMQNGQPGAAYNISDGHPSNMTDYFNQIADRAGLSHPPTVTREEAQTTLSPGMLSFLNESKRLVNRKMIEELGVELRYPDLESGLSSCFK